MRSSSPLGKYAQATAALVACGVIGAWVTTEILFAVGLSVIQPAGLKEAALIALGSVFGAAVAVNGVKHPIETAHQRLDLIDAPHVPDGEVV